MVTQQVLCIGETMAQLTPADGVVESAGHFLLSAAGAESNVAVGLSHLGHLARWYGRVGDDALGRRVTVELSDEGVDIGLVEVDPGRPTGLFVKAPTAAGTVVSYYRAGSAGSALNPAGVDSAMAAPGLRHVHVSGVTPALSAEAHRAVDRVFERAAELGLTTSFDVNLRPALWPETEAAAAVLLEFSRRATVVFVGLDEARALCGSVTAQDCRALLPGVPHLVIKDGSVRATEYEDDDRVDVAALRVAVVEVVGAGDAFAAGWLHGLLTGEPAELRLRFGHLSAGRALESRTDFTSGAVDTAALRERALREWGPLVSAVGG